jgi:hypothetical protein
MKSNAAIRGPTSPLAVSFVTDKSRMSLSTEGVHSSPGEQVLSSLPLAREVQVSS